MYRKLQDFFGWIIYSGDHDLLTPFISTQAWIRSLNYSVVDKWRPWMIHNQVAGYTQTYANKMTYATVKASFFFLFPFILVWIFDLCIRKGKIFIKGLILIYREVGIHQNINQRKALSCFGGGLVANLYKKFKTILQ